MSTPLLWPPRCSHWAMRPSPAPKNYRRLCGLRPTRIAGTYKPCRPVSRATPGRSEGRPAATPDRAAGNGRARGIRLFRLGRWGAAAASTARPRPFATHARRKCAGSAPGPLRTNAIGRPTSSLPQRSPGKPGLNSSTAPRLRPKPFVPGAPPIFVGFFPQPAPPPRAPPSVLHGSAVDETYGILHRDILGFRLRRPISCAPTSLPICPPTVNPRHTAHQPSRGDGNNGGSTNK